MKAKKNSMKKSVSRRILFAAIFVAAAAAVVLLIFIIPELNGQGGPAHGSETVKVGMEAPDFTALTSTGEHLSLSSLRGEVVVLSFVYCSDSGEDVRLADTDGQVTFLSSMNFQYGPKGVTFLFVDATYIATGRDSSSSEFINFGYNHHVGDMQVLEDSKKTGLARRYGVTTLPTTFIVSREGVVTQRLDGLALSSQLAMGIEALAGAPWFREDGKTVQDVFGPSDSDDDSEQRPITPAQAIFRGYDMARALSDEIWLVDGGKYIDVANGTPVKWLVLGGEEDSTLKVSIQNVDTGESLDLGEYELLKVAHEEAASVLTNLPGASPDKLFEAGMAIGVPTAGYYTIRTEVLRSSDGVVLYSGSGQIVAR